MKNRQNGSINRRSFMKNGFAAAGVATMGTGLLAQGSSEDRNRIDRGDTSILRFLAAAELIEADLWLQYNELGGIQDSEVPGGSGSPLYTAALQVLDEDLAGSTLTSISDHLQAIANTAGFHFGFIEQGGTSLYAQLAQRVTSVEVLRVLLSIGGTEICHFQTWHDNAGNAPPLTDTDPVTGSVVVFPDLNAPPLGGEEFQTNLIMPEPTIFLSRSFPVCSIIRPTETEGAATAAANALIADGLFIGQSQAFFELLGDLAAAADAARRRGN